MKSKKKLTIKNSIKDLLEYLGFKIVITKNEDEDTDEEELSDYKEAYYDGYIRGFEDAWNYAKNKLMEEDEE